MHRAVAILLLLLVPLRVFGAELAGICMLQSAGAQVEAAAMPDDCPMKAKHDDTSGGSPHGKGCQSCELCMPLAAPDAAAPASWSRPQTAVPVVHHVAFRSAVVSPVLKPPIS